MGQLRCGTTQALGCSGVWPIHSREMLPLRLFISTCLPDTPVILIFPGQINELGKLVGEGSQLRQTDSVT